MLADSFEPYMREFESSDANTPSRASVSSSGFDGSSSHISTLGSWDESEQEYESKATKQVADMLERLETILYNENGQKLEDPLVLEECGQWSRIFPHLRVKGSYVVNSKEVGHEMIEHGQVRSQSPYFIVPARPLDTTFQVSGIGLSDSTVARPNDLIRDEIVGMSGFDKLNKLEFDEKSIKVLVQLCRVDLNAERWAIFSKGSGDIKVHDEEDEEEVDEERASTPTPMNIVSKAVKIKCLQEGSGGLTTLIESLKSIKDVSMESLVACVRLHSGIQEDRPFSVYYLTWTPTSEENVFDVLMGQTLEPKEKPLTMDWTQWIQPGSVPIFHVESSTQTPLNLDRAKLRTLGVSLNLVQSQKSYEQTFASHGLADEWYAKDQGYSLHDVSNNEYEGTVSNVKVRSTQPLTPIDSIKQDLIGCIFEDMWAEISICFQSLVEKLDRDLSGRTSQQKITKMEPEEDEELSFDLLSAITIRPVPLQKRDMMMGKSRPETSMNNYPDIQSRPTSAKPNQRPLSARSTLRPTSAKHHEAHLASMHRYQQQISAKTVTQSAWKSRNTSGLRLIPIQMSQNLTFSGMNDMVLGTGIMSPPKPYLIHHSYFQIQPSERPGTTMQSKKLPPLRNNIETEIPFPVMKKHVAFHEPFVDEKKSSSPPRPRYFFIKCRRQVSAAVRGRPIPRPHTAFEEMRYTPIPGFKKESTLNTVTGMRMAQPRTRN